MPISGDIGKIRVMPDEPKPSDTPNGDGTTPEASPSSPAETPPKSPASSETETLASLSAENQTPPDPQESESIPETPPAGENPPKKSPFSRFKKSPKPVAETAPVKMKDEKPDLAGTVSSQVLNLSDGEYLVFRFKKRNLLLTAGIIIVAFWLFFLARLLIDRPIEAQTGDNQTNNAANQLDQEVAETKSLPIRIRYLASNPEAAEALAQLLMAEGYNLVDLLLEPEPVPSGVTVAVKPDQTALFHELTGLIMDQGYILGEDTAELTPDSDFAAVIIIGTNQ